MNRQIILERDESKGINRVFYFDGDKKSHVGDVADGTFEFTPCPSLENPEELIPLVGNNLLTDGNALIDYTRSTGLLLVSVFLL